MNNIGKKERETQNRLIALFQDDKAGADAEFINRENEVN